MHLTRRYRLGVPQDSREPFDLLAAAGRMPAHLVEPLKRMVGFRNIAVHDYRRLSKPVVEAVVPRHKDDLMEFARHAVRTMA